MRIHFFIPLFWFLFCYAAYADNSPSEYYTAEELRALGLKITAINTDQTLICDETGQHCVCQELSTCKTGNNQSHCPTFEENINAFNAALNAKQTDSQVICDLAETGQCDSFSYFHFDGGIERHETRWFDRLGQLIAQRNTTDYPSYCNGQTTTLLQGKIPKCNGMETKQHLCGRPKAKLPTIIETITQKVSAPPSDHREEPPISPR